MTAAAGEILYFGCASAQNDTITFRVYQSVQIVHDYGFRMTAAAEEILHSGCASVLCQTK